jgi:hypothetical protein
MSDNTSFDIELYHISEVHHFDKHHNRSIMFNEAWWGSSLL